MNHRTPFRLGLRRDRKRPPLGAFRRRILGVERLEARELLSGEPPEFTVSDEFRVNTETTGHQQFEAFGSQNVAMDADGDAVVVWVSDSQDGSLTGVFGQRFAADGAPVGQEFQVNLLTQNVQANASVAMDVDGGFVVTWSSLLQDGSDYGVYARLFDATGKPRGGEFRVNEKTEGYQRHSAASMDAQGNLLIVWNQRRSLGELVDSSIMGRRYDSDGAPLGPEFQINEPTANLVSQPRVARNAQGDYVVAWLANQGLTLDDVIARTFAADGTPSSGEFRVHQYSVNQQLRPSVAIDGTGQVVVAWYNQTTQDNGGATEPRHVYLRRFALDGTPLGDDVRVNSSPQPEHRYPTAAITPRGDFVVAWAGHYWEDVANDTFGVFIQSFGADGEKLGDETQVNVTTSGDQTFPTVATDNDGDLFIAWMSVDQDGSGNGIYARRYDLGLDLAPPVVGNLYVAGDDHAVSEAEILVQQPERFVVTFSEAIDAPQGNARSQWRLTRNGVDESDRLAVATYTFNGATNRYEAALDFNGPLPAGDYSLVALPTIRDLQGRSLDGNYDAIGGDAFVRRFTIAAPGASGGELTINHTVIIGDQTFGDGAPGTIARDASGNFTIVWTGPGEGTDVYARRFDASGNALADEFVVNGVRTGDQGQPTIAMSADGSFAIAWTSIGELGANDADLQDIYLRRFAPDGTALGVDSRINSVAANIQQRPTIAMNARGDAVVAWETGSSGADIHFQRFLPDGARSGEESPAQVNPANTQRFPHAAMDDFGDFVLTWTSFLQAGSHDIYARRFSAAEGPLVGREFLVHTATAGIQSNSAVAIDASGHFVIVWQSGGAGVEDVYAQRFEARSREEPTQAFPIGAPILVHASLAGSQQRPSVAMDRDGDFIVAWQSNNSPTTKLNDIAARRFSWNGVAQGEEIAIADAGDPNQQTVPNIAVDALGNFILAWTGQGQESGGTGTGIFAQRFVGFVNSPPVASAGGPYFLVEGKSLQLNASASADIDPGHPLLFSFAWDLDRDGAFDDLVGVDSTIEVSWDDLTALGITDDGLYTLAVRVTDPLGASDTAEATLSVSNAAPSEVTLTPGPPIDEGGVATISGVFDDPGRDDEHEVRIDWGDNFVETQTLPAGERSFLLTHPYLDNNGTAASFPVTATVIDDDGDQSSESTAHVVVQNARPRIISHQLSANPVFEGTPVTLVGRVEDAGPFDQHTVRVNWGDGTAIDTVTVSPVTGFTATHTYADNQAPNATIVMQVIDSDLGSGAASTVLTVENADPEQLVLKLWPDVVAVGDIFTLSGSFVDSGAADSHIVSIDWKDGNSDDFTLPVGARAFSRSHRYLSAPAIPSILVTMLDDDLGNAAAQASIRVISCGLIGDTNFDCKVDLDDLNAVRNNFGQGVAGGPHILGDAYPFDGLVNLVDLNAARNQFGVSAAPESRRIIGNLAVGGPAPINESRNAVDAVFARWSSHDEQMLSAAVSVLSTRGPAKRRLFAGPQ